jgi:hypothetical protein
MFIEWPKPNEFATGLSGDFLNIYLLVITTIEK